MAIAQSSTREKFPLSTKKVLKKTITASALWMIVLFVIYGVLVGFMLSFTVSFLGVLTVGMLFILLLMMVVIYMYQQWYYNVYFYDLTADYVVIKKGPITPHEITIPYERIQDVYVDQDILDRLFGLYDVHLSSATISSGMAAHIDGVEKPAADGLRAALLEKVSRRISRNREPSSLPPTTAAKV